MAGKSAPPRPAPRLYLATPEVDDASQLAASLPGLLAAADVAAVLVRLKPTDQRTMIGRVKALAPAVQNAGAALLIDGHSELVARAGADGAHLGGITALEEALPSLKPDRIAGIGGLETRHDAMVAAESGADYVMFGDNARPSIEALIERVSWWTQVFEIPCVAYATALDEIAPLVDAGAEFIAVGDAVFADPRGAARATADAGRRLSLMEAAP